jgi:uncharacterized protein DUF2442
MALVRLSTGMANRISSTIEMKSVQRGQGTSEVEVANVSPSGFRLLLEGRQRFVPFKDFPWFRDATIAELTNVLLPSPHHLYWPALDVDLAVDSLEAQRLTAPVRLAHLLGQPDQLLDHLGGLDGAVLIAAERLLQQLREGRRRRRRWDGRTRPAPAAPAWSCRPGAGRPPPAEIAAPRPRAISTHERYAAEQALAVGEGGTNAPTHTNTAAAPSRLKRGR